jgi:uroporphyrinogen III methyltransferase/synthase
VHLVPPDAVSDDLARAFLEQKVPRGSKILLPGPHEGRTVVRDALLQNGYDVTEFKLYRLEQQANLPELPTTVDAVVFSSPSAVSAFLECHPLPAAALVVSIGPVTSEALRSRGLSVHREATRHDIQGLIEVLL